MNVFRADQSAGVALRVGDIVIKSFFGEVIGVDLKQITDGGASVATNPSQYFETNSFTLMSDFDTLCAGLSARTEQLAGIGSNLKIEIEVVSTATGTVLSQLSSKSLNGATEMVDSVYDFSGSFSAISQQYAGSEVFLRIRLSGVDSVNNDLQFSLINVSGTEQSAMAKAVVYHTRDLMTARQYYLQQNYPNPFNPVTTIEYVIPQNSHVHLAVYDILGKEVSVLEDKEQGAGHYRKEFNAGRLASGLYFYRLTADKFIDVKKLLIVK